MPSIPPPSGPFSEADFERLDDLLWEGAVPRDGMNLEAVDGFFSAVYVSPHSVEIDALLPAVWGGGDPPFEEAALNEELLRLLQAFWRSVCRRINHSGEGSAEEHIPAIQLSPELFEAVSEGRLDEFEDDTPYGADWAAGFEYGMYLQDESWEERLANDPDLEEALGVVFALAEPDANEEGELLDFEDAEEGSLAGGSDDDEEAGGPEPQEPDEFEAAVEALGEDPEYQAIEAEIRESGVSEKDVAGLVQDMLQVISGGEPREGSTVTRERLAQALGEERFAEIEEAFQSDEEGEFEADWDGEGELAPLSAGERLELIAELPAVLYALHLARLEEQKPRPARKEDEIGRNDPCPCGSGRKYKKCHGAPGALH